MAITIVGTTVSDDIVRPTTLRYDEYGSSNAVRLLSRIDAWNGYIKLYSELDSHFEMDDMIYLCYSGSSFDSNDFTLDNVILGRYGDEYPYYSPLLEGYKVLDVNQTENSFVINKSILEITRDQQLGGLQHHFACKVRCNNIVLLKGSIDSTLIYQGVLNNTANLHNPGPFDNIDWFQGIMLGGNIYNLTLDQKYDPAYTSLICHHNLTTNEITKNINFNNDGLGYSYFYNLNDTIYYSDINGGTYENCRFFGSGSTNQYQRSINGGYLLNSKIENYVIRGGIIENCTHLNQIVWSGGTWRDENNYLFTFDWFNGTFDGGTFAGNIWYNGVFNNGWFKGNTSDGSSWRNGVFNGGIFGTTGATNTWLNGIFNAGLLKNVNWYNGSFNNGNLELALWYNGTFNNGILDYTTWFNGTFNSGQFLGCSYWLNGTFNNGTLESSAILNGRFLGGTIVNSEIYNGTIDGSNLNDVSLYRGTIKNTLAQRGTIWSGTTFAGEVVVRPHNINGVSYVKFEFPNGNDLFYGDTTYSGATILGKGFRNIGLDGNHAMWGVSSVTYSGDIIYTYRLNYIVTTTLYLPSYFNLRGFVTITHPRAKRYEKVVINDGVFNEVEIRHAEIYGGTYNSCNLRWDNNFYGGIFNSSYFVSSGSSLESNFYGGNFWGGQFGYKNGVEPTYADLITQSPNIDTNNIVLTGIKAWSGATTLWVEQPDILEFQFQLDDETIGTPQAISRLTQLMLGIDTPANTTPVVKLTTPVEWEYQNSNAYYSGYITFHGSCVTPKTIRTYSATNVVEDISGSATWLRTVFQVAAGDLLEIKLTTANAGRNQQTTFDVADDADYNYGAYLGDGVLTGSPNPDNTIFEVANEDFQQDLWLYMGATTPTDEFVTASKFELTNLTVARESYYPLATSLHVGDDVKWVRLNTQTNTGHTITKHMATTDKITVAFVTMSDFAASLTDYTRGYQGDLSDLEIYINGVLQQQSFARSVMDENGLITYWSDERNLYPNCHTTGISWLPIGGLVTFFGQAGIANLHHNEQLGYNIGYYLNHGEHLNWPVTNNGQAVTSVSAWEAMSYERHYYGTIIQGDNTLPSSTARTYPEVVSASTDRRLQPWYNGFNPYGTEIEPYLNPFGNNQALSNLLLNTTNMGKQMLPYKDAYSRFGMPSAWWIEPRDNQHPATTLYLALRFPMVTSYLNHTITQNHLNPIWGVAATTLGSSKTATTMPQWQDWWAELYHKGWYVNREYTGVTSRYGLYKAQTNLGFGGFQPLPQATSFYSDVIDELVSEAEFQDGIRNKIRVTIIGPPGPGLYGTNFAGSVQVSIGDINTQPNGGGWSITPGVKETVNCFVYDTELHSSKRLRIWLSSDFNGIISEIKVARFTMPNAAPDDLRWIIVPNSNFMEPDVFGAHIPGWHCDNILDYVEKGSKYGYGSMGVYNTDWYVLPKTLKLPTLADNDYQGGAVVAIPYAHPLSASSYKDHWYNGNFYGGDFYGQWHDASGISHWRTDVSHWHTAWNNILQNTYPPDVSTYDTYGSLNSYFNRDDDHLLETGRYVEIPPWLNTQRHNLTVNKPLDKNNYSL